VRGGVDGPALRSTASLGLSPLDRLVSRSLADREDECVRDGPHQFPVAVVVLVCLLGGGFGSGHGVPFLMGRHMTPTASGYVRRLIQLR
jgi:hypothetical protein